VTRRRGLELQGAWARFVRPWFPAAASTPNGIGGNDLQNTPGIFWEVKTIRNTAGPDGEPGRNRFDPKTWVESAIRRAKPGQLVIGVFFPERIGAKSPERAIALVPAHTLMYLLERAGYTEQKPTEVSAEIGYVMHQVDLYTGPKKAPKHPEGLPF
jgi:hypothetical protein